MTGPHVDASGQRFGRLLALKYVGIGKWLCLCDCGTRRVIAGHALRTGRTYSCGCGRSETRVTHGKSKSPEFTAWRDMRQRCQNPKNASFANYGGRGIRVCERYDRSFDDFLADVGPRPSPRHSIDRIDNNRGYEPGNLRWATVGEQLRNRRTAVLLTHDGRTLCVGDWARELGIHPATLWYRVRSGWSVSDALKRSGGDNA